MSDKLNYAAEKAKLDANFWNGLAVASVAIGALPFVIGLDGGRISDVSSVDWAALFVQASAAFLAVCLARFFRTLALRSVSKACEGF